MCEQGKESDKTAVKHIDTEGEPQDNLQSEYTASYTPLYAAPFYDTDSQVTASVKCLKTTQYTALHAPPYTAKYTALYSSPYISLNTAPSHDTDTALYSSPYTSPYTAPSHDTDNQVKAPVKSLKATLKMHYMTYSDNEHIRPLWVAESMNSKVQQTMCEVNTGAGCNILLVHEAKRLFGKE